MTTALIIAGHGSHSHLGTALPVWTAVDAIRQTGLFEEVTAAFWKEQPAFGSVLQTLHASQVIVVPMFSSEGYFSTTVLPAELNPLPHQSITITPAVGTSDYFIPLIQARVDAALQAGSLDPAKTTVVIVGHGTSRYSGSQPVTPQQADQLREARQLAEVRTAYLDEAPFIRDIYAETRTPHLIVVPFFMAEGLHTQEDIPALLNLQPPFYEPQVIADRRVVYTPPVGLEADLYRVVLALAGQDPAAPLNQSVWTGIPALPDAWLHQPQIGQVSLRQADYLCHMADQDQAAETLQPLETPAAIRAYLRVDAAGNLRPLASARNLRQGWKIPAADRTRRLAALETIYPGSGAG